MLALVQNDPQKPGLQDTCVSKLEEFLGDGASVSLSRMRGEQWKAMYLLMIIAGYFFIAETAGFVAKLFKALADGSYKASNSSRANSAAPSDEQQFRSSNAYDDDYCGGASAPLRRRGGAAAV